MSGLKLDLSDDYRVMDNIQPLLIVNPDGTECDTPNALQRNRQQQPVMQGEAEVWRVTCNWHVWQHEIDPFVPQQHGHAIDRDGNRWFINAVGFQTLDSRYSLQCSLESGTVIR